MTTKKKLKTVVFKNQFSNYAILLAVFFSNIILAQTTVTYSAFTTVTCPDTPVATISTPPTGLTFSQFSRGSGVTCATANGSISGSLFNNTLTASISAAKWFTFSITSDASTSFTLNSLNIVSRVSNASGTPNVSVQYSIGTGTKTVIGSYTPTGSVATYTITPSSAISVGAGEVLNIFIIPNSLTANGTTCRVENNTSANVTATTVSTCTTPADPVGTISATPSCGSTSLGFSGTAPTGTKYYWQTSSSGTSTTNQTTGSYAPTTSGTYYVRSKSDAGNCWSAGTVSQAVTVVAAPSITSQPANQAVTEPSTATFSVTVSNAASYQWQEKIGAAAWTNVGSNSNSYTTPATSIAMNGYQYKVVITGNSPCATIESEVKTLTVNAAVPPTITSSLTKSTIYGTGDTYTITASNTPTSYSTGTLPAGFSFSGAIVTKASNVEAGIYNISISATNAGGTDTKTLVWTVTPKPLTINGLTGVNKVYDGSTATILSGSPSLVGIVFSDDVSVTGTPTVNFTTKDVGTNKPITVFGYSLTGTKAGNYSVSQPTGLTANVTAKSLTITSVTVANKVYDGTNAATITGTLSGIISPDVVTFNGTGTFASVNVGTGISVTSTSTLGGANAGNYSLTQPTGLSADITKANQTITFTAIPTLGVGNTYNLTLVASSSSGLALSFSSASTNVATVSGSTLSGVSVGTSLITASQSGNGNYNAATSVSQTVTVALEAFTDGDFRTKGGGVWNNRNDAASTVTWQKYNGISNIWEDVSAGPSAVDTNVYIATAVEIPVSTTISGNFRIVVRDTGVLTFKSSSLWTFRNIIIKSGGTLDMQTRFTVLAAGNFEIENGGNFWYSYPSAAASTLTASLWAGNEIFHPDSNFIIKNHDTGSGIYFLPAQSNISANTYNGVTAYFGNLISDSSSGDVRMTTTNFNNTTLTHGNLEIRPNGSYALLYGNVNWTIGKDFVIKQNSSNLTATPNLSVSTANTITLNVKGSFINNSKSNFRLSNSTAGTITLNIDGNLELRDEGKFDAKFNAAITEVNLKGDLLVDPDALLRATAATNFNFTGTGDGLTAATTQNIDVASTVTNENSNLNFNIKSGAYVQLLNRNFELGTNSKLTAESGSTLDFGFNGTTALNIARVGSTAGQSFASDAGSVLKITSPDGISNGTSVYTGNVQVGSTATNRVFSPAGTFYFIGKANAAQVLANGADQISGNGLPSDASSKNIIVDLNTSNAAQDDVSFKAIGVNKFSSAGSLKIIKGTVIDISGNGFADGTAEDGKLVMTGGRYKISRGGTQPSMSGDYDLTGGVIEFAGSASVQIRTGAPAKQYLNVDISGTNVETGGKNFVVNNLLRITDTSAIFTVPEVTLDSDNPYVVTAKKGIQIVTGGKALFKNNAVLLQDKDAVNSGNITMERKATVPSIQYNFWSSPVKDQALYSLYNVPNNSVMAYNSANDKFNVLNTASNPKSVFAKGYSIKGSPTMAPALTATFTGEPNNESTLGVNTIALSTAGNNYNLIGNPYPSNLDIVALFNDSDNFSKFYNGADESPTAYLWDNTSNTNLSQLGSGYVNQNYAIVNLSSGMGIPAPIVAATGKKPNGILRPGQGFIMRAMETGGSLTFKNALMRTSGITMGGTNSQHFKNSEESNDNFYLKLTTPKDMHIVIAMAYHPAAENSFERFDSAIFSESVTENFYSLSSDSKKLAIQGRKGNFNKDDVIRLGFKTSVSGNQKISLEDKGGVFSMGQNIYLKDKLLNQTINLTNGDYTFQSVNGTDLTRFEIVFKENAVLGTDSSTKSDFEVYRDGTDYVINSSKILGRIDVYDVTGRLVISKKSTDRNFRLDSAMLSNGVYIIKAENSGDVRTKKIIK
ncbi:YDG domain-containing protein [Epilithonimonas sp. JDS]|uniref:YDG domain-containing protein n=1 Tax=Epilithonimonas sp. JDS TaxID=2902797 RepID=UPI001E41DDA8|nr:YDG domain-containing protein [Epilithonimonas sp. JDS]MCD9853450.1 YDG domain-containing protein [Epilithonimonas sp. JDS]